MKQLPRLMFACCAQPGCEWSQTAKSLRDAWYLCWRHNQDSHDSRDTLVQAGVSGYTQSAFRPTAIDYELCPRDREPQDSA